MKHRTAMLGLLLGCTPSATSTGGRPDLDTLPGSDDSAEAAGPLVILVSTDGFRHDYAERTDTPALDAIASAGVRATSLQPIVPTKTFPNHYTLVTGLYAESHGIVDNYFEDPTTGDWFSMSSTESHWWGGEPIWVSAERQDLVSATCFWPGSSSEIGGLYPSYYLTYDGSMSYADRVAQVLEWIDLPVTVRPNLITLYFSSPDSEGHSYGPDSDRVLNGVRDADEAIGWLLDGLTERALLETTDLIVVSDHGMSQLSSERLEALDAQVDLTHVETTSTSPFGRFEVEDEHRADFLQQLETLEHTTCYDRAHTPRSWHYRDNDRISDVICVADDGWTLGTEAWLEGEGRYQTGGTHGFAPDDDAMHGIFYARGPSFTGEGDVVDTFEAVEVYNVLALALGIEPVANDGDLDHLPAGLLAVGADGP